MNFSDTTISRWLKRAEGVVSIYTILAGIAAYGFGAYFVDLLHGFYLAVGVFGAVGAFDMFHRQRHAELDQRCQYVHKSGLVWDVFRQRPNWKPKIIQEFAHSGFRFKSLGFEEIPNVLFVTYPLCPACGDTLAQRGCFAFPYRPRFRLYCKCGYSHDSEHSSYELQCEAEQLANAVIQK